jgi:hypothetical protein
VRNRLLVAITGIVACVVLVATIAILARSSGRPASAAAGGEPPTQASASAGAAADSSAHRGWPQARTDGRSIPSAPAQSMPGRPPVHHPPAQPSGGLSTPDRPPVHHPPAPPPGGLSTPGRPPIQHPAPCQHTDTTSPPPPAPAQGLPTFERVTAGGAAVDIAPDGLALTIVFSDLEAAVGNVEAASEDSSTTRPVVLQLTGSAATGRVRLGLSGYAFTAGATARLILDTGGHRVVRNFRDNCDDEFLQTLNVSAVPGARIFLSITLDVRALAGSDERSGYLNVLALDAEIV